MRWDCWFAASRAPQNCFKTSWLTQDTRQLTPPLVRFWEVYGSRCIIAGIEAHWESYLCVSLSSLSGNRLMVWLTARTPRCTPGRESVSWSTSSTVCRWRESKAGDSVPQTGRSVLQQTPHYCSQYHTHAVLADPRNSCYFHMQQIKMCAFVPYWEVYGWHYDAINDALKHQTKTVVKTRQHAIVHLSHIIGRCLVNISAAIQKDTSL